MDKKERQALQQELARQGFVIRDLGSWPPKATYYKPNGEAMRNLPADPYSMQRYLARGFTLVPPERAEKAPEPPVVTPSSDSVFKCDHPRCRFSSPTERGLMIHKRKHQRESK